MTKINQEEYELLKGLDDKWRWIARDSNSDYVGQLFAYLEKPFKSYDVGVWDYGSGIHPIDINRFQFIQWEDKEPYNIQELIDEYEIGYKGSQKHAIELSKEMRRESEEAEVKRDKEDLVKYLEKEISNFKPGEMIYDYLTFILKQLNQLDEPKVLSQDLIDKYSYNIEEYWEIADMMVEPQYAVSVENLPNLLVPKQELPAIPQFVADYLDFAKSDVPLMRVMELANTRNEWSKWEKEYDWISANDEAFARAWLDGFTVANEEEEQKYYVDLETAAYVAKWVGDGSVQIYTDSISGSDEYELHLTEQEIKDYDERFWPFRKPVEEVEE